MNVTNVTDQNKNNKMFHVFYSPELYEFYFILFLNKIYTAFK